MITYDYVENNFTYIELFRMSFHHVPSFGCKGSREKNKMRPNLYLIITNISKSNNIKSLLLAAYAYGTTTVFVVGQPKFNIDVINYVNPNLSLKPRTDLPKQLLSPMKRGEFQVRRFNSLEECVVHIREIGGKENANRSRGVQILGVEIVEGAQDIDSEPFDVDKDTAIMMGNEGSGMNRKQMKICDGFLRISQYGGGTASLNVNVAANIVMHRFNIWARLNES